MKRFTQRQLVLGLSAIILSALFTISIAARVQKPSPPMTAEMTLNGKKVTIKYSAPSMRGRKIMGGLVPFGKVWRTGANEATVLTTETDLMIGNVAVPKGSYTLWTLPGESAWKLIINKQTGQWGTQYDEKQDLARVDMKVGKTSAPVEQFVISLAAQGKGGVLKMEWENTSVSVNLAEKK